MRRKKGIADFAGTDTMRASQFLSLTLASGGDRRIAIRSGANANIYGASPFPRAILGYASSTANDVSAAAFAHLEGLVEHLPQAGLHDPGRYAERLEALRAQLRSLWAPDPATEVVFAPSGTDLEYVALALAAARGGRRVTNVLLGPDEVGSGCGLAASGRYFADETAVCARVERGEPLAGLEDTLLAHLPVRDGGDRPLGAGEVAHAIDAIAAAARVAGRDVLAHVVHGSKTGLVLPGMAEVDRLIERHGERLTLVVDACQTRIEPAEVRAYLARGCIVLLTGSKFVGGPPFSGFALVPPRFAPAAPLAAGLARVFRRGEWPAAWRGLDHLEASANPGLLLRLEAAWFELARFANVPREPRERVIAAFGEAVRGLAQRLGATMVEPSLGGGGLHQSTLATIDLAPLPGTPDLALAQRWHRVLAARGLRLGQPVKCVRHPAGGWAGNLRVSLSMPLIVELAGLDADRLGQQLAGDMARIADVLEAAQRPVVA